MLLATVALVLSVASAGKGAHAARLVPGSYAEALTRSRVYVDAQADARRAPDITAVVLANDDAGRLSLTVSFANRVCLQPSDVLVVGLDVDRDEQTGGPLGMDYALSATTAGAELGVWSSSSWSGSGYVPLPGAATLSLADQSLSLSTTVGRLGALMEARRPRLRFVLIAIADTDQPEESWADDVAGPWSYRVQLPTKLLASKIVLAPHPRAGGDLTARLDVTMIRGDYRETLNSAAVKARAVITGRPLQLLRRGSNGSGLGCGVPKLRSVAHNLPICRRNRINAPHTPTGPQDRRARRRPQTRRGDLVHAQPQPTLCPGRRPA
jgi:hypothetical protein